MATGQHQFMILLFRSAVRTSHVFRFFYAFRAVTSRLRAVFSAGGKLSVLVLRRRDGDPRQPRRLTRPRCTREQQRAGARHHVPAAGGVPRASGDAMHQLDGGTRRGRHLGQLQSGRQVTPGGSLARTELFFIFSIYYVFVFTVIV